MRATWVTLADLISGGPITVSHDDTVAVAARILRTEGLSSLPVVANAQFAGLVTAVLMLGEPPNRVIADIMRSGIEPATPNMLPAEGYRLLTRQGLDVLPVADHGRFIGAVPSTTLVAALNQQIDPLTGLPWAASLRTWARETLLKGREIAILFLDLDNFGLVNKVSGHVMGDECLSAVAHSLAVCVDRRTDALCRYGGDEFAIGTTRRGADLETMVRRVREAVDLSVDLNGSPHRLRASVGVAGGRRAAGRTASHVASLIENLIAEASLASTLAKGSGRQESLAAVNGAWPQEPRCRLVDVTVRRVDEDHCAASVTLALGRQVAVGTATVNVRIGTLPTAVATSTLQAVTDLIGPGHTLSVRDHMEIVTADKSPVSVVTVLRHETLERWVGAASAADHVDAAAQATLDAVNRRLGRVLGDLLRRQATQAPIPRRGLP